jgi:hypothetical protein
VCFPFAAELLVEGGLEPAAQLPPRHLPVHPLRTPR